MKKALITVFAVVCLFIPTYIAIFLYNSAQSQPVRESSVTAIDLKAPDGKVYTFGAGKGGDDDMIALFINMNSNAKSAVSLPKDLEGTDHYTVIYHSYDMLTEYNYYFSRIKPSNSYYTDNEGRAFRIDASYTIEFLDSEYSSALYYELSAAPVLTVCGAEIVPSSLEWHYYSYSSVSHEVNAYVSDEKKTVEASYASIPMSLTVFPDSTKLVISSEGNTLFSGTVYSFAEGNYLSDFVTKDTILDAYIEAIWNDSPSLGYGGRIEYSFRIDCKYDPAARFSLGESAIEIDEFVVLTCVNVDDPQSIEFSSEPSIHYDPKFYTDGEYVRSLIPVSSLLGAESGKYTFTVKYNEETVELELTVRDSTRNNSTRKYNYNSKVNTSVRTNSNLAAFSDFIVSSQSSGSPAFKGSFLFDDLGNNRAIFGDTVNNGKESDRFISNGLAFVCYEKQTVRAVNNGTVVAVGTTKYGGKTVVVDHGWGVRSVYYCLRTVSVGVGDVILKGETVGLGASSAGYSDGITAYIELWVENVPVSYFHLLENGRASMIKY